jgi:hypothetical protein
MLVAAVAAVVLLCLLLAQPVQITWVAHKAFS